MVDIVLDKGDVAKVENALAIISPDRVTRASQSASQRAAKTARAAGTRVIRDIYNIKGVSVVKSGVSLKPITGGTELRVKGGYTSAQKYFKVTNRKKKGVFVSIKKGTESRVPLGFLANTGVFMQRKSKDRYPLKGIYGPALPQMFGNEKVVAVMQQDGMEMYEKRLAHELDRALGGN